MNDTIDCADSSPRLKAGASSAFCGEVQRFAYTLLNRYNRLRTTTCGRHTEITRISAYT